MSWYIYNVDTKLIAQEFDNYDDALNALDEYDQDLYGLTGTPAFGAVDGLIR